MLIPLCLMSRCASSTASLTSGETASICRSLFPCERNPAQPLDNLSRADRLLTGAINRVPYSGEREITAAVKKGAGRLHVVDDGCQRLVQFVCQHRRHLPHRTQTQYVQQFCVQLLEPGFGLPERHFGVLGCGNVARNLRSPDQPAVGIVDRRYAEGGVQNGAVFVPAHGLIVMNALAASNPVENVDHVVSVLWHSET